VSGSTGAQKRTSLLSRFLPSVKLNLSAVHKESGVYGGTSEMICGLSGGRRKELGSAASKPAPFAGKKSAKDAAPGKSIRGAIESPV